MILNFTGTCQLPDPDSSIPGKDLLDGVVGWDRNDLHWSKLEPEPGQWRQEELEKWGQRVLELRSHGIEFLPILCYSAPWAIDQTPRTLAISKDKRVTLSRDANGGFLETTQFRQHDGTWETIKTRVPKLRNRWPFASEYVAAWENYVRRVVTFLSSPPYNVKYFQIWNEAHPESGFYDYTSLDDYMIRVHLPAAKIIHEQGAKVVYGGWPCCGSIRGYISLLDRHDAWKTVDVHDMHYFPLSAFEAIQSAARKRGLGSVAIWQTEFGWSKNPSSVGNAWPRFLDWALRNQWDSPDKYKIFWFAARTPDDPKSYGYQRTLIQGNELSPHGLSLKTIVALLSPGDLSLYEPVVSSPALGDGYSEHSSALYAFRVG
ncbi:MAG: hypothetical protein Q7Q73_10940, partial [Verrucomicrobiota bacterium JB024]|nr:hypothetical protein [Verrucomicrobiota bacterium JB024]